MHLKDSFSHLEFGQSDLFGIQEMTNSASDLDTTSLKGIKCFPDDSLSSHHFPAVNLLMLLLSPLFFNYFDDLSRSWHVSVSIYSTIPKSHVANFGVTLLTQKQRNC
jgi:hypothetical protein